MNNAVHGSFQFTSDLSENDKPIDDELLAHTRICISKLTSDYKTAQQVPVAPMSTSKQLWFRN